MFAKKSLFLSTLSMLTLSMWAGVSSQALAASLVTADHKGGYSAVVMEKVLSHWTAPSMPTDKATRILLEINEKGALELCTVLSSSGAKSADDAACTSARAAAPFAAPPHAMPTDVYMAFWTGKAVASPQAVSAPVAENTASKPLVEAESSAKAAEAAPHETAPSAAKAQAQQNETITPSSSKAPAMAEAMEQDIPTEEAVAPKSTSQAQHSMTYAGIDYSQPKPTLSGHNPLQGMGLPKKVGNHDHLGRNLVGTTLPPLSDEDEAIKTEPTAKPAQRPLAKPEEKKLESPAERRVQARVIEDDASSDASSTTAHDTLKADSKPYAPGKKPFIQDNRKGQVMDHGDYYINSLIRKVAQVVQYPADMPAGIVSASLNVYVTAAGQVLTAQVSSSSGNAALDTALVEASKKVQGMGAHPSGEAQTLYLIFTVETPE